MEIYALNGGKGETWEANEPFGMVEKFPAKTQRRKEEGATLFAPLRLCGKLSGFTARAAQAYQSRAPG